MRLPPPPPFARRDVAFGEAMPIGFPVSSISLVTVIQTSRTRPSWSPVGFKRGDARPRSAEDEILLLGHLAGGREAPHVICSASLAIAYISSAPWFQAVIRLEVLDRDRVVGVSHTVTMRLASASARLRAVMSRSVEAMPNSVFRYHPQFRYREPDIENAPSLVIVGSQAR